MADNVPITAGTGTNVATDQLATGEHVQYMKLMDGTLDSTNKAVVNALGAQLIGGGVSMSAGSGSITSSSTVIGPVDVSNAGNITVTVSNASNGAQTTYIFEASDDAGTTWFTIQGVRQDNGVAVTGDTLPVNTAINRMYDVPCEAFNRFRLRATAYTASTTNPTVRISYGTMPFTSVVSAITQPPARVQTSWVADSVAGTAAIGLLSLTPYRALVAGTATTTPSVTVGKTFRISAISITLYNSTTTQEKALIELRAPATGAVSTTSPIIWSTSLAAPGAVANQSQAINVTFPDGALEIPAPTTSNGGFGLTQTSSTTARFRASIHGYEY